MFQSNNVPFTIMFHDSSSQLLQEIRTFLQDVDSEQETLKACLEPAMSLYDQLDPMLAGAGVKGKKALKARENFAWNVGIIRGQMDRLLSTKDKCKVALEQVRPGVVLNCHFVTKGNHNKKLKAVSQPQTFPWF